MEEIKKIGNYYGGLNIKQENGKYYWLIENHNTDFKEIDDWDEIPEYLYSVLKKYNASND